MRRWLSLIGLILAVMIGSTLGVLNPDSIAVDLLFVQLQIPLGLALSLSLVCGLLLGALAMWLFKVLPLGARLRKAMKSNQRVAKESSEDTQAALLPASSNENQAPA